MEQSQYLRPMELGEILDASVRLYRENFRILIAAQLPMTMFYLVSNVVTVYVMKIGSASFFDTLTQPLAPTPSEPQYTGAAFVILILQLIVYPLTVSAVIKVASDCVLQKPLSIKEAYRFCAKILGKLVTTHIILSVAMGIIYGIPFVIGIVILFYMVYSFNIAVGGIVVVFIFMVIAAVAGGFVWIRWVSTFAVAVNENNFNLGAMRRSWDLMKGYTGKMFLVMVLVFLIPTVFELSPEITGLFLRISAPGLSLVFGVIALGILIPLVESARVIVYFQLRTRKEGFDLTQKIEKLPQW